MILAPVLRYVVSRLLLAGLVIAALNVYGPLAACAPNGARLSVVETIEKGNQRILEVIQTAIRRLP